VSPETAIRLVSVKQIAAGALRGFANLQLLDSGLFLHDCAIWSSNGRAWVTLPSKAILGRDGQQVVSSGVRQYTPCAEWPSREVADRWSAAVVTLVKQRYPELFDADRR
jgi:hypothetical protein